MTNNLKKILKNVYFYGILFGKVFESSAVLMPGVMEHRILSDTTVIQILLINNSQKKFCTDYIVCWKYLIQLSYFETDFGSFSFLPFSFSA